MLSSRKYLLYFHNTQLHSLVVWDQRVLVVVLNVTEEYLWVYSNEPLMDFDTDYIHDGTRVNEGCETNL